MVEAECPNELIVENMYKCVRVGKSNILLIRKWFVLYFKLVMKKIMLFSLK